MLTQYKVHYQVLHLGNMYIFIKSGNNCIRKLFKEDFMRRDMRKNESKVNDFNDKIIKYYV